MGKKHWIQAAVPKSHKGKFGRYAAKHGGMTNAIAVGLKSKNSTVRHEAQFAKTMLSINRK
jgi:hypothetical protein